MPVKSKEVEQIRTALYVTKITLRKTLELKQLLSDYLKENHILAIDYADFTGEGYPASIATAVF